MNLHTLQAATGSAVTPSAPDCTSSDPVVAKVARLACPPTHLAEPVTTARRRVLAAVESPLPVSSKDDAGVATPQETARGPAMQTQLPEPVRETAPAAQEEETAKRKWSAVISPELRPLEPAQECAVPAMCRQKTTLAEPLEVTACVSQSAPSLCVSAEVPVTVEASIAPAPDPQPPVPIWGHQDSLVPLPHWPERLVDGNLVALEYDSRLGLLTCVSPRAPAHLRVSLWVSACLS